MYIFDIHFITITGSSKFMFIFDAWLVWAFSIIFLDCSWLFTTYQWNNFPLQELLKPNGILIPAKATIFGQIVEAPEQRWGDGKVR